MKSVMLTAEGYDFIKLTEDKKVINVRTGNVLSQKKGSHNVTVWDGKKSVPIPVDLYWRKHFANEIESVPEEDKRDLGCIGMSGYVVTSDGRVWNKQFYTWQKPLVKKDNGYVHVGITDDTHRISSQKVHRLVAQAFMPIPEAHRLEVNHKNGDKTDNRVQNLEWTTSAENNHHARKTGLKRSTLSDTDVHRFCQEWATGKHKTAGKCAKAVGLPVTACEHIINHGAHTQIASIYGIPYKKPVRLTPIDWKRYPKRKYLKRPTGEQSSASTPSNCEKRLRACQPQT